MNYPNEFHKDQRGLGEKKEPLSIMKILECIKDVCVIWGLSFVLSLLVWGLTGNIFDKSIFIDWRENWAILAISIFGYGIILLFAAKQTFAIITEFTKTAIR